MPIHLENVVMTRIVNQEDRKFSNEFAAANANIDFDMFGAKEIRDVLKSRAHCLRAGFSARHIIIMTLNEIRDHYILKIGLPTYLSQMLGEVAKAPIQDCTLYDPRDQVIKLNLDPTTQKQSLQRFIAQRFQWNELPFRIEVCKDGNRERIEVRYL